MMDRGTKATIWKIIAIGIVTVGMLLLLLSFIKLKVV